MRYFILFGLFVAVFLAGCVETPEVTPTNGEEDIEPPECYTVTEEVPVTEEVCEDISVTEQVCEKRELEYKITYIPKVDLCIEDGACVGEELVECPDCSKAMTRCIMKITNEDTEPGTWTVGANYTLGNSGFIKDPITQTIAPGESFDFDFEQIYAVSAPINSASCALFVIEEPIIDDCYDKTKVTKECANVTTMQTVEIEVCD